MRQVGRSPTHTASVEYKLMDESRVVAPAIPPLIRPGARKQIVLLAEVPAAERVSNTRAVVPSAAAQVNLQARAIRVARVRVYGE